MAYRGKNYRWDDTQCSFCPTSSWTGSHQGNKTVIRVCSVCAVRYLPALMADSLWSEKWIPETGERDWAWAGTIYAHVLRQHAQKQPHSLSRFDGVLPSPPSNSKGGSNV